MGEATCHGDRLIDAYEEAVDMVLLVMRDAVDPACRVAAAEVVIRYGLESELQDAKARLAYLDEQLEGLEVG